MMLRIWDLESGLQIAIFEAHTDVIRSIAVTLDPRILVVSGGHDDKVKIWDLELCTDLCVASVPRRLSFGQDDEYDEGGRGRGRGGGDRAVWSASASKMEVEVEVEVVKTEDDDDRDDENDNWVGVEPVRVR